MHKFTNESDAKIYRLNDIWVVNLTKMMIFSKSFHHGWILSFQWLYICVYLFWKKLNIHKYLQYVITNKINSHRGIATEWEIIRRLSGYFWGFAGWNCESENSSFRVHSCDSYTWIVGRMMEKVCVGEYNDKPEIISSVLALLCIYNIHSENVV